jgi:hypothetical protein
LPGHPPVISKAIVILSDFVEDDEQYHLRGIDD